MIRPDRDPQNPSALIDLDDIKSNLKDYPTPITKEDLLSEIRRYDLVDTLTRIGQISGHLYKNIQQPNKEHLFTLWRLSYWATLAILYAPSNETKMSQADFTTLMMKINRYVNDNAGLSRNSESIDELEIFAFRLMFFDNLFNKKIGQMVARNQIIFREILSSQGANIDLSKEFKEITGVSLEHYSDIGMAISASFLQRPFLTQKYFEHVGDDSLKNELDSFLRFNAISVEDFKKTFTGDIFELTPFLKFPIICIEDKLICPNVVALLIRSYDLFHIFFSQMKRGFSDFYGGLFESYVGDILIKVLGEDKIIFREIDYDNGSKKSVDWFVKEGKTLILFECKNKRFHVGKTITAGDINQLNTDVEQSIAEAVFQLSNSINLIENQTHGEFKIFEDVREFIPVVVVPEAINANSIAVRRRVEEILRKKYTLEINFFYHVIEIEELERILPFRNFNNGRLLRNLFNNKLQSSEFKYRSFSTYIYYKHSKKIPDNSYLHKKYWQTAQISVKKFFPNAELKQPKGI